MVGMALVKKHVIDNLSKKTKVSGKAIKVTYFTVDF